MKPITSEWVDKAEADLATARREIDALDKPNYDAVCFHTQQCAEKYLKACLQEADISFRKTHDLSELLDSTLSIDPTLESLRQDLNSLSAFAVEYRYPGESADLDEAQEAFQKCKNVREVIRRALQLED
jgi:HEPN domain-containing protein